MCNKERTRIPDLGSNVIPYDKLGKITNSLLYQLTESFSDIGAYMSCHFIKVHINMTTSVTFFLSCGFLSQTDGFPQVACMLWLGLY